MVLAWSRRCNYRRRNTGLSVCSLRLAPIGLLLNPLGQGTSRNSKPGLCSQFEQGIFRKYHLERDGGGKCFSPGGLEALWVDVDLYIVDLYIDVSFSRHHF